MNFSHVLLFFLIDIRYLYSVLLHFHAAIKKAPNLLIRKPTYSISSNKYFLGQDVVVVWQFFVPIVISINVLKPHHLFG